MNASFAAKFFRKYPLGGARPNSENYFYFRGQNQRHLPQNVRLPRVARQHTSEQGALSRLLAEGVLVVCARDAVARTEPLVPIKPAPPSPIRSRPARPLCSPVLMVVHFHKNRRFADERRTCSHRTRLSRAMHIDRLWHERRDSTSGAGACVASYAGKP